MLNNKHHLYSALLFVQRRFTSERKAGSSSVACSDAEVIISLSQHMANSISSFTIIGYGGNGDILITETWRGICETCLPTIAKRLLNIPKYLFLKLQIVYDTHRSTLSNVIGEPPFKWMHCVKFTCPCRWANVSIYNIH